jgi:hypothetical protein
MFMKKYFPLFIFSMLLYQANAMQQPQQTKEQKLKELREKFDRDCKRECWCRDKGELRSYCYDMCKLMDKTLKEFGEVLSKDK